MLKKEFQDSLRVLVESSLILLAIPVMLVVEKMYSWGWDTKEVLSLVSLITAFIYAALSGISLWQIEKKEDAFEYLFSLPLSRSRLFFNKFLPRFSILLVLLVIVGIFNFDYHLPATLFYIIFVFLASLFLSLTITSTWISFIEIGLLFYIFDITSKKIFAVLLARGISDMQLSEWISRIGSAAFLLVPLGIASWWTLKNMDAKPLKVQLKPYLFIPLPAICLLLVFILAA